MNGLTIALFACLAVIASAKPSGWGHGGVGAWGGSGAWGGHGAWGGAGAWGGHGGWGAGAGAALNHNYHGSVGPAGVVTGAGAVGPAGS
ncbi:PREDICTED: protein FAM98B-like, partial [Nicrophorus vespilloides]|uniref:Protein FAM98B-like n=1 Tax=Nicrophorus vespilloides TaxID=110193 RepID=A0ABM1NAB5_NICVS